MIYGYVLWKFAEHRELAQRFLVALMDLYDEAFRASQFYNVPRRPQRPWRISLLSIYENGPSVKSIVGRDPPASSASS